MGNPMSGKNCRIGQIIAIKMHDLGTPGTNGDKISWKWFSEATAPTLGELKLQKPDPGAIHLCQKTIIGGNLVVHQ